MQRGFGARLPLLFAVLLAFLVQGYATQTHIHIAGQSDFSGQVVKVEKGGTSREAPSKDDPSNCPICQQIMLSGAFIAPSAALPLLPIQLGRAVQPIAAVVAEAITASHDWQSRGPPTH